MGLYIYLLARHREFTAAAHLCTKLRSRSSFVQASLVFDHFVQLQWFFFLSRETACDEPTYFFPVNGPFVCSCLGLICLNLMRFTCFWMSKKLLQRKKFCTLHKNLLLQWKNFLHCTRIFLLQWKNFCTLH